MLPILIAATASAQPASSPRSPALLDPADAVVLLLDHQSGLFQTVKDISVAELRTNTIALASLTRLMKVPIITTASVPDGPNGPLMPEKIQQANPAAIYEKARSARGRTRTS